jgi:hypothetical protein
LAGSASAHQTDCPGSPGPRSPTAITI